MLWPPPTMPAASPPTPRQPLTPKSKRSLVLPKRAVTALQAHKKHQAAERLAADAAWQDNNLVFCHETGACTPATRSTGGSAR